MIISISNAAKTSPISLHMSEAQKVKIGQTNINKSRVRALKKNSPEIKIVKLKINFKQYADYMASNKSDHD